jgi:phage tail tube protein FII
MVTRKLIRVTSPEAAALLTATGGSSFSSAAEEDSPQVNKQPTTLLSNGNENKCGGEKRALPSENSISGKASKKRHRADGFKIDGGGKGTAMAAALAAAKSWNPPQKDEGFVLDLSDVPPQLPIPRSKGEGASKYTGVSFHKASNKWMSRITIDGKNRHIGFYVNEVEAAIDYARAVFKYKGQDALDKAREQKKSAPAIDLSNVPSISPILKSAGEIKEGASKYAGVYFNKTMNKWHAQITFEGKTRRIGNYEKEEVAAIDYARAVFKYKGQGKLDKAREQKMSAYAIDLKDVPPQLPILKSEGNIKGGTSKYVGVNFDKVVKKWKAIISIDRKLRHIGYYENEEDAAADYARAVFKFKGQDAVDKAREQNKQSTPAIDLSDVPPKQLIPKSEGRQKEGASKYAGVSFHKSRNKWKAVIRIEGKLHHIGYYKNEEEAAIDYARAIFKYKGQDAPDKAREQNSSGSKSAFNIDLSDVPPQPPILKNKERIKEGSSKYMGVSFRKANNKWEAKITIDGKQHHIGLYENEEEAAIDYARAIFKYKGERAAVYARSVNR